MIFFSFVIFANTLYGYDNKLQHTYFTTILIMTSTTIADAQNQLTHWGRVTHICVGNLTSIASDNGLSPSRCEAIIWTNAGILLIRPLGTNFSEILIEIHTSSFKKMHSKMSSAKRRPFCLGLNVLNGLSKYCFKHRSIMNSVKTKFMVYGRLDNVYLYFNGHALEQVTEYKYLGNIVRSVDRTTNDVFAENYEYLCNKARRSIFSIFKKTKNFGSLPPKIRIYLFDSFVRPVLIYGCAIWGTRANGREQMDKIHLMYLRSVLGIKTNS